MHIASVHPSVIVNPNCSIKKWKRIGLGVVITRLTYSPLPKFNNARLYTHTLLYLPLVQLTGNKLHQNQGGEKHLQQTSTPKVHQMLMKVCVLFCWSAYWLSTEHPGLIIVSYIMLSLLTSSVSSSSGTSHASAKSKGPLLLFLLVIIGGVAAGVFLLGKFDWASTMHLVNS